MASTDLGLQDRVVEFEETDQAEIKNILRKVTSDDSFRKAFRADPKSAIENSGENVSRSTIDVLVEQSDLALTVTENVDNIEAIFFYSRVVD